MKEPGRSVVTGLGLAVVVLAAGALLEEPMAVWLAPLVFLLSVVEGYVTVYGWPFP